MNPAGLVDVPDSLDFGLNLFRPSRGATITQGNVATEYPGNGRKSFFIPSFGYAHKLNDRVTLGVAVYGNGGMNTDYTSNPYARFGATGEAGVDLSQAFISPTVAVRIGERQSLGISANIAYQRFKAKGLGPFAGFSQDGAHVTDRGYDDSIGYGLRIGWQAHVTDGLSLGATWQSRTEAGRFKKYAGLFADQAASMSPRAGAWAWHITQAMRGRSRSTGSASSIRRSIRWATVPRACSRAHHSARTTVPASAGAMCP